MIELKKGPANPINEELDATINASSDSLNLLEEPEELELHHLEGNFDARNKFEVRSKWFSMNKGPSMLRDSSVDIDD